VSGPWCAPLRARSRTGFHERGSDRAWAGREFARADQSPRWHQARRRERNGIVAADWCASRHNYEGAFIKIKKESAMTDDKANRGPQDRSRVNLSEDYEVRYWTKELGVTKDELARLVHQHGNSVEKLRQELGR